MAGLLMDEIADALASTKDMLLSFIGHSMGAILIRCLLSRHDFQQLLKDNRYIFLTELLLSAIDLPHSITLHAFISMCGPHLGVSHPHGLLRTGTAGDGVCYCSYTVCRHLADEEVSVVAQPGAAATGGPPV